jgi:hypothetical protein
MLDCTYNCLIFRVFKPKLWKLDLKSTNVGLYIQLFTYKKVQWSITLQKEFLSNSYFANLKIGIFIKGELAIMA